MSGLPPELLAELQKEYIKTFPEKAAILTSSIEKQDFDSVQNQLHKMAGSGATYGMPEITKVCRTLENYLQDSPDKSFRHLASGVELVKRILAARTSGTVINLDDEKVMRDLQNYQG